SAALVDVLAQQLPLPGLHREGLGVHGVQQHRPAAVLVDQTSTPSGASPAPTPIRAAKVVPRPAAIRSRIATDGFAWPSSIWVSIRRETSLSSESAPTLRSSAWRAARIRSPSCSTTAGRIPPLIPALPARRCRRAPKPSGGDGNYIAHGRGCALCCATAASLLLPVRRRRSPWPATPPSPPPGMRRRVGP